MGGFFATFKMGFKSLWKYPASVVILTAFPIVLILILGTALDSFMSAETDLPTVPLAVAADENGPLAVYLKSPPVARFFELTFVDSADEAEQLIQDGHAAAAVIEQGYEVHVLLAPRGGNAAQLTLAVIDAYRQMGAAAMAAMMEGREIRMDIDIPIAEKPLGGRIPNAIDYYAVTMIVMILLYTGLNGGDLFNRSLFKEMGDRNFIAPISKPALIGGLLAASTLTSFLQGMVTFVFSGVVYGVYWGERIPLVLVTLFGVVLFSQALCIFFMMFFKGGAGMAMTQSMIWVMTFVSGGYFKVSFGDLDQIFQYVPNALAHTVIFGAVYGGDEAKMFLSLAILFGIGGVLSVLAFVCGRRRLA